MALTEGEILGRLREAVLALKDVRSQRDALLREKSEPIAIIGMACRFPGGGITPEGFFNSLLQGVDAVTAIPPERWKIDPRIDADPNMQGSRWGAFVRNADLFDPAFFGISPREAERMDPQQRFLLEAAWEALERSGIVPESLNGSKTGVFVGILNTDYYYMNVALPREQQDAYSATGNGHCFPAGRLAYTFGFQGPAIAIDTACSSSLVATHLGCQSLHTKESDVVLVCGVNLMLDSLTTELIGKTGALASDGRCKSFDARANGIVRGEGCGVFILKRLSDAQRDGDPIFAVIRGSAVNQDGRSTGLTAPNALSQQAMLEQALVNAQLTAEDIGYIETHGTGTPLGDPIEMEALRAVFGKPRAGGDRCFVGTVKTNIGHLEAAAGVAGLMKAVFALHHEKIPKNLHFRRLNPRISLEGTSIAIATDMIPWPRSTKPRRAGVSSFGMSGTNAHVILEEAPRREPGAPQKERSAYLLPLSAKTPEALSALVSLYAEWFSKKYDATMDDVVHTASARRTHHEHRIAVVARTRADFLNTLSSLRDGATCLGVVQGHAKVQSAPRIAFVFPGQGAQWIGMSKALLEEEPAFREAIEACDRAIQQEAGFSILQQIGTDESQSRKGEIDVLQPLLFAMEVALAALWQSWGISPDCVVGHSMGEVAAAHVAGALSLGDAVAVICRRSQLLRKVIGQGAMALVELALADAEKLLVGFEGRVSIAASNGPRSTVFAGNATALDEIVDKLEREGVFCQRVKVNAAAHSPQMDPLRADLLAALPELSPKKCRFAMLSTVTGANLHGNELAGDYWVNNLREPVKFYQAIRQLVDSGFTLFIEMSPHPVLVPFVDETLTERKTNGAALSSLRWRMDDRRSLLDSLGRLYVHGVSVEWKRVFSFGGAVVELPTYPWQRERYWIEPSPTRTEILVPNDSIDDWLFNLEWRIEPIAGGSAKPSHGTWLVLMDSQGIGENIAIGLKGTGSACIRVEAGQEYARLAPDHYRINVRSSADYARLLGDALGTGTFCRGVIHLFSVDAPSWDETTVETLQATQQCAITSALYLTQAIVRRIGRDKPRLWLISRGAVAIEPTEIALSVAQAPLWGLGRTIMLEHPELGCSCVDLELSPNFDAMPMLLRQFETEDREEHVAFRLGRRLVARFSRGRITQALPFHFALKADANYLITGGLGGLGLSVAQWMVTAGARHVTLMGRRGPSESVQNAIRDMEKAGAKVLVLQCDIAQPDNALVAFCTMSAEMPELRGVVHSAGLIEDRTLLELSDEQFQRVFAPKVAGAWNLHTLTSNQPLDFFVMYSSAASLFGSAGQGNYAAANAFLDALAHARLARGLPAMSIHWGPFTEIGLAAAQENRGTRLESRGVNGLSPADGLRGLRQLLERPRAEIGIIRMNVRRWLESFPELTARSLWLELAATEAPAQPEQPAKKATSSTIPDESRITDRLVNASPTERATILEDHVCSQFGKVLRMDPSKIERHEKIHHYGVDSLMAIELRNRLRTSLDIEFSITEIWTHGSVAELAKWLTKNFDGRSNSAAGSPSIEQDAKIPARAAMATGAPGQWVVIPRPSPNAKMRLICFPYAGGGAPVYSSWHEALPPDIEVCAIQPPGRHARITEPFAQSVEEMVDAIVPALILYLDRPFAMFGHCLGAIVMFEVVRRLASDAWAHPIQIFASGAPAPPKYLFPNVGARSDEEFLVLLRAIGIAQQEVLNDADIVRSMLPMVRADFALAAKYEYEHSTRITVPITTFAGDADAFSPPDVVEAWRHETSSHFSKHTYAGEHYFLVPERDSILRTITLEMEYRLAAIQQQRTQIDPIRWIVQNKSQTQVPLRLICFPGLGGSAMDFQYLAAILPPGVEVCAVEFPGHGTRANEAPLGRIDEMVDHVREALRRHLDGPYVFLGHDLGALVMYEIAVRLNSAGSALPKALIVIAATAPQVHYFAPIHYLARDAFSRALGLLGTIIPNEPTSVRALQSDCAALATYGPTEAVALPVPITAFLAEMDKMIAPASVYRWKSCTTSDFTLYRLPCGHHDFASNSEAQRIVHEAIVPLHRGPTTLIPPRCEPL